MTLIETTDELAAVCARLRQEPFVTVDTEFMRDRTYWPKLCLVQLGGAEEAVAVDPMADGIDLAPLVALLRDPKVTKVLHACRQDMEIFYRIADGKLAEPLFDTQVAAMVCGYGEEVGYETLVNKLTRNHLDKSSRFTDWSKRPLTKKQIAYALGDVTHLRQIYQKLLDDITERGRTGWVEEELAGVMDPKIYEMRPEDAWRRLKFRSRDPRFVALVQAIASWREQRAQQRDIPRNRVLRDDLIMELAANRPTTIDELRGLDRINIDREGSAQIIELVKDVLARPAETLPQLPPPREVARGIGPLTDLLKVLLKYCAEENDVGQKLIATSADLEAIAEDDDAEVPALRGWRRELFGERALELKRGRLALAVGDRRIRLVLVEPPG